MAKKTTRKQLVLQERAEEFNYEDACAATPWACAAAVTTCINSRRRKLNAIASAMPSDRAVCCSRQHLPWTMLPSSSRPGQINLR